VTDHIFVLTTVASDDDGRKIADELVSGRLAACVSVTSPVHSTYRWKGEIHRQEERILLIKTLAKNFERVRDCISKIHPYDVPEIIALDVTAGETNYLNWLTAQSTRETSGPE